MAYVVARAGASPTVPTVERAAAAPARAAAGARGAGVFVLLERMPLTPSGKVNRLALPAPEQPVADASTFVAPRTGLECELAASGRTAGRRGGWRPRRLFHAGRAFAAGRAGGGQDRPALAGHAAAAEPVRRAPPQRARHGDRGACAAPAGPSRGYCAGHGRRPAAAVDRCASSGCGFSISSSRAARPSTFRPVCACPARSTGGARAQSRDASFIATQVCVRCSRWSTGSRAAGPAACAVRAASGRPARARRGPHEAALARLLHAEGHEPFDLARGPLLRARLLRLATTSTSCC